jgi:chromosome partitioning protein
MRYCRKGDDADMVITIAFGKGGSCKTTTAAALVNYAKSKGKTVLAIDCDPQGNFTFALNGDATAPGLHSVLIDGMAAADAVQTTEQADLIAAGLDLAAAETAIANRPGRDFILRKAIEPLRNKYDYIVLDTQPDLNSIIINALTAADAVLLPIQANSFSMMGLYQMQTTISQVQQYCNPELTIAGIVLTKYKPRQTLAKDLRDSIAEQAQEMGTRLFDTFIREAAAVEQAQAMQQSLFEYAPRSTAAQDYAALFHEMKI